MSSPYPLSMGLTPAEQARLGHDAATRVQILRLVIGLSQRMRTRMDQRLRVDGLTTQQAALISVVDTLGTPALSEVARSLGTTHQNARQIADALVRKGFLRIEPDPDDGRIRRVHTTERSRSFWSQRSDRDQDHVAAWFADLTPAEATTLFELLYKVAGALDRSDR